MTNLHRRAFDHAHQTRQLCFEFLRHRRGFQKTLQLAGGFSPLLGRIFAGNVNNTVQTLLFIQQTNSVAFQISEICPLEDVPASRRRGVFLRPQRLPRKFLLAAGCCCRGKGVGVPGCERSSADATHVQAGQRRTCSHGSEKEGWCAWIRLKRGVQAGQRRTWATPMMRAASLPLG